MLRIAIMTLIAGATCLTTAVFAKDDLLILHTALSQSGYPDWSPDGEFIVITTGQTPEAEGNLWLLPVAGGEPVQITEGGGHHGNFSPDGKFIALDASAGSIVQVIPASGGAPIRIVPENIVVEHSGNPCWSPDGRQIAFRASEELYTLELATGNFTRIFHLEGTKPLPIQWLKSENCIIVSLLNVEDRTANLHRVDVDTGETEQLTNTLRTTQGTVSPDEKLLVYSTFLDPDNMDYDLWVVPLAGGESMLLLEDPSSHDMEPCWSPAGDQIVYVRFFEGEFRIQIMDVDVPAICEQLNIRVNSTEVDGCF